MRVAELIEALRQMPQHKLVNIEYFHDIYDIARLEDCGDWISLVAEEVETEDEDD